MILKEIIKMIKLMQNTGHYHFYRRVAGIVEELVFSH